MIGTDDGNQEKESHWLPLIGLKDDMKFTPQNHSAVKGQTPWLLKSVVSNFWRSPSRRVSSKFRARACVYFARPTIAIAKIRDYSQSSQH